ncbi:hypothetical protein J4219_05935 [Candidatus Woesearchaeota archaeon]|nr:hypothetical protein [Candidatus Woesearchaeota archaeon]
MEYNYLVYGGFALLFLYLGLRVAGTLAFSKLVSDEFDHIIASDEHKVKGRFE